MDSSGVGKESGKVADSDLTCLEEILMQVNSGQIAKEDVLRLT